MTKEKRQKMIESVHGMKKERDFELLELMALHPEYTQEEVNNIQQLKISQQRISKIVNDNMRLYLELVSAINPLATAEGRVVELVKHYRRKEKRGSNKDIADLLDQIRRETTEQKASIINVNPVFQNIKVEDKDTADVIREVNNRLSQAIRL